MEIKYDELRNKVLSKIRGKVDGCYSVGAYSAGNHLTISDSGKNVTLCIGYRMWYFIFSEEELNQKA